MADSADGSDTLGVVERGRHDEIGREPSGSWPELARRTKRWLDLSTALVLLVVLAPFMSLIAITVRLDSPGPALFRQVRVGQNGRHFRILKFRTLAHGAPSCHHERYIAAMLADCHGSDGDARAPAWTAPITPFKDPNATRVGRWLRKTSLDELPQLVNVLRGDM
ncbi:MAG TPA: sugar transferase, partial [Vicinamibacterales bacterium]|nr:sugar transferase [Vicinamibacterales bacterium]